MAKNKGRKQTGLGWVRTLWVATQIVRRNTANCFKVEEVARVLGLSELSVRNHLARLEEHGLVSHTDERGWWEVSYLTRKGQLADVGPEVPFFKAALALGQMMEEFDGYL